MQNKVSKIDYQQAIYSLILDSSSEAVLILDQAGDIIEANNRAQELYGYAPEEFHGLTVKKLLDSKTQDFFHEQMEQVIREGVIFETIHKHKHGNTFPVRVRAKGTVVNGETLVLIIIDNKTDTKAKISITERQKQYFSLLHEVSLSLINRLDPSELLDQIVTRAATLVGTRHGFVFLSSSSKKEMEMKFGIGECKSFVGLKMHLGEGVTGKVWKTGRSLVVDDYSRWTERIPGEQYAVFRGAIAIPLKSNANIVGVIGFFHTESSKRFGEEEVNILERLAELASIALNNARLYTRQQKELQIRKQIELALKGSEELFRSIVENISFGISVLNPKMEILSANALMKKWYPDLEISQKPICYKTYSASPCEKECLGCMRKETLMDGKIHEWITSTNIDGDKKYFRIIATPLLNKQEEVTAIIEIAEDITARRKVETEIQEKNDKLKEALESLKQIQVQMIQGEKLAGIGQLAAGVAHEINNPLGFVSSNFETLKKYVTRFQDLLMAYRQLKQQLAEGNTDQLNQLVSDLNSLEREKKINLILEDLPGLFDDTGNGLQRVSEIVTGLRNFSRIDAQSDFAEFDLNSGIKSSLLVARNEIKYYANVEEDLAGIPMIEVISGQINQVLLNIIVNAAQAIKYKELKDPGLIRIKTWSDDTHVYCEVEDNGIGMTKKTLDRVFEPFFTTKPVGQGTGLGLSVSYDIVVNKHGGHINAHSELGVGTALLLKLPIKQRRSD